LGEAISALARQGIKTESKGVLGAYLKNLHVSNNLRLKSAYPSLDGEAFTEKTRSVHSRQASMRRLEQKIETSGVSRVREVKALRIEAKRNRDLVGTEL